MKYENKKRVDEICNEIESINYLLSQSGITKLAHHTYKPILTETTVTFAKDLILLYETKLETLHLELENQ